jgi:hypothetical protein
MLNNNFLEDQLSYAVMLSVLQEAGLYYSDTHQNDIHPT